MYESLECESGHWQGCRYETVPALHHGWLHIWTLIMRGMKRTRQVWVSVTCVPERIKAERRRGPR